MFVCFLNNWWIRVTAPLGSPADPATPSSAETMEEPGGLYFNFKAKTVTRGPESFQE